MSRIDNEIILNQLNWRYACKKFDPTKKIRETDWNMLLETLRLSASSYGLQPWKFIVVQDPAVRQKLLPAAYNQTPTVDASHFVVLTYKEKMSEADVEKLIQKTAQVRQIDAATLAGYKSVMINDVVTGPRAQTINFWSQRQTYIAMGSLLTVAALMEIDTLPMEGIVPTEFDRILNLEGTGYKSGAAIACGYRSTEDGYQKAKKVRYDLKDVVTTI